MRVISRALDRYELLSIEAVSLMTLGVIWFCRAEGSCRMSQPYNVTQILKRVDSGDSAAADDLLPLVYDELRRIASEKLLRERPGQTIQATALVHEAWLRLVDVDYVQKWSSRRHFFGAAAEAMRRILVDRARRSRGCRHGGGWQQIAMRVDDLAAPADDSLIVAVHEALDSFQNVDPIACELVKLRYFAGLSLQDAGNALGLAPRTTDRLWAYARAWLLREVRRTEANLG
jgi:RNA polymerase sigma factor (TIGR02999 family)